MTNESERSEMSSNIHDTYGVSDETLSSAVFSICDCAMMVAGSASDEIERRTDLKQGEAWDVIAKHIAIWMMEAYLTAKLGKDFTIGHEPNPDMDRLPTEDQCELIQEHADRLCSEEIARIMKMD